MTPSPPTDRPLVSIGMPLRNADEFLEEALEELVGQTYANLEIILSNNNSTDRTREICQAFAARDKRIRYFEQDRTLSGPDNFQFVWTKATGLYFMWAAHDDRHDLDYVETLVDALDAHPEAALVFSDAADFADHRTRELLPLNYPFETDRTTPFFDKIKVPIRSTHFYGLYRRAVLDRWYWHDTDFSWDQMVLAFVATQGDIKRVPGTMFYYYRPGKSVQQRSKENAYRGLLPFPGLRRAWALVKAGVHGEALNGRRRSRIGNFLRLYIPHIWWPWLHAALYRRTPRGAQAIWKRWKARPRSA